MWLKLLSHYAIFCTPIRMISLPLFRFVHSKGKQRDNPLYYMKYNVPIPKVTNTHTHTYTYIFLVIH